MNKEIYRWAYCQLQKQENWNQQALLVSFKNKDLNGDEQEHLMHFCGMLFRESNLLENEVHSPTTDFLIKNHETRFRLFSTASTEEREQLMQLEQAYYQCRDKYLNEAMSIRDLQKNYSFHRNLYLALFGASENKLEHLDFKIRLFCLAAQIKQDKPENSPVKILKEAFQQIIHQQKELIKQRKELIKNKINHSRLLLIQQKPSVVADDEALRSLRAFKRQAYLRFSNILLYDVSKTGQDLSPELQKKLTSIQQEFLEVVQINEMLVKKASIFSQETSEEELNELNYRAGQLLALGGTVITDEFQILNYDAPSPEELIRKIRSLISHLERKVREVMQKGALLFSDEQYRKWASVNDLSDDKKQQRLAGLESELIEKRRQFKKIKDAYYHLFDSLKPVQY